MNHAVLVKLNNPFAPYRDREVRDLACAGPIRACAPNTKRPFVILRNNQAVLRSEWDQVVEKGDIITVVMLPQGGGGGSNPLRLILMIAVAWFAPYAASMINTALGGAVYGTFGLTGMSILSGAVGLIGTSLVNALVPPPKPPTNQLASTQAQPSPTYSLQAQGNSARLDTAIPVQYGRSLSYPDFAAQPYTEFAGNEQYLYQLLCLGQGEYDIEAIRIEDTPLSSFSEIQYEVVNPGDPITLFPANVVTSIEVSGQELEGILSGASYSQSGTTITITYSGHRRFTGQAIYLAVLSGALASGDYVVASVVSDSVFTVTAPTSATTSGSTRVDTLFGPFTANPEDTQATTLGVDVVLPRGLYSVNTTDGSLLDLSVSFVVEYRPIDDALVPLGAWQQLDSKVIMARTPTPQRYSYRYAVPAGRYQVRARRTNTKNTSTSASDELVWASLRAYMPDTSDYGDVTLIAMRMRASNNLSNQASRKINVISTRKIPVWTPTGGWSAPVATRSIAWAYADAAMNQSYGAKLAANRIDIEGLYALDQVWSARGDYFDGRFDNALIVWEAFSQILKAGRAKPYMQAGILFAARDQASTLPVAMYSMRNIQRGSFGVEYLMPTEEMADAVDVTYFDNQTWKPRRVVAKLPSSIAEKPAKIDLFGVTDRQQAYREGMYQAASNAYRRRLITFTTEMEGFIPSFGDLIIVQHDMVAWGQFGEVVDWNPTTKELTLTDNLEFTSGTHYIGLRRRNGGVSGPYVATQTPDPKVVVLDVVPDEAPYTGHQAERTHISFGPGEAWRQPARVISVRPIDFTHAEITCINEDDRVHLADQGITAPEIKYSQLNVTNTAPVVYGLIARSSPTNVNQMLLSWQPSPGADHYLIEQSNGDGQWLRSAETSSSSATITALYSNATIVRVAGVGLTRGPWVTTSFALGSDYMWSATDTDLMWSTTSTDLMWRY